jgi:predicted dehydrogenase
MATPKRVKLAIVGGRRGAAYQMPLEAFKERAELTAICDRSEAVLATWKKAHPDIQTFNSLDQLLASDVCTAVALATPMPLHASQAVKALEAGKHVMTEVVAATTVDECWQLVEAVQKTGLVFMMAENYCYARTTMMVLNMVEKGVFGEITYAEGGYIHDTRDLSITQDGEITWRGELRQVNGNTYPTHSLGPVAQWLGAIHGGTDRLVSAASWTTPAKGMRLYLKENLGLDHPNAKDALWPGGDSATTVIQTEKGALVILRRDSGSLRPHNMFHFELQGTKAAYISGRQEKEDPLVWIDGQSPGRSPGNAEWEPLFTYSDRYEHPRWRQWGDQASQTAHGGGDFFILDDFIASIQNGTRPGVDVYDAVTWSSIMPLSIESIARGNIPLEIPNFARGA